MANLSPLYPGRQVKSECTFLFFLFIYSKAEKVRKRIVIELILYLILNSGERNVVDGKYLLFFVSLLKDAVALGIKYDMLRKM